jgi:hypothetical protein
MSSGWHVACLCLCDSHDGREFQTYLFLRTSFLWREGGLLQCCAAVNVRQGERLRIRMELVALGIAVRHSVIEAFDHLVLVISIHWCFSWLNLVWRLGQLRHALERILLSERSEVTRHDVHGVVADLRRETVECGRAIRVKCDGSTNGVPAVGRTSRLFV